jgi:hypothetical protein
VPLLPSLTEPPATLRTTATLCKVLVTQINCGIMHFLCGAVSEYELESIDSGVG